MLELRTKPIIIGQQQDIKWLSYLDVWNFNYSILIYKMVFLGDLFSKEDCSYLILNISISVRY